MSEEARNTEILREAYRLWHETKGKSVDHWLSICADEIEFGSIGQSVKETPYMTIYDDKKRLGEYFAGIARDWEMVEFRIEHYVAQADRIVALGRCSWRARKTGKVVWTPIATSIRMVKGKMIEYYEYFDTAQMRDALAG